MASTKKIPESEEDCLDGLTVMERAERILGSRLTFDSQSYLLDGKRVSSMDVLKAAGVKRERVL